MNEIVAVNARHQIRSRRLRVAEIAAQMGVTRQYMHRVLNGESNLTLDFIAKLADVLDVDVQYLLTPISSLTEKGKKNRDE